MGFMGLSSTGPQVENSRYSEIYMGKKVVGQKTIVIKKTFILMAETEKGRVHVRIVENSSKKESWIKLGRKGFKNLT